MTFKHCGQGYLSPVLTGVLTLDSLQQSQLMSAVNQFAGAPPSDTGDAWHCCSTDQRQAQCDFGEVLAVIDGVERKARRTVVDMPYDVSPTGDLREPPEPPSGGEKAKRSRLRPGPGRARRTTKLNSNDSKESKQLNFEILYC